MPIQTGARQSLDIWCGAWLLFSNHLYPSTSPDANGCLTVRNRISSDLTHKQEVARGAGQMRPGLGMGRVGLGGRVALMCGVWSDACGSVVMHECGDA